MSIKVLSGRRVDDSLFSNFINSMDNALLYYTPQYRDFITELLVCEAHYLFAMDCNEVVGVLPIMFKDGPLGRIANSLPFFGSNGGVLAINDVAEELLWEEYRDLIEEQDVIASTVIEHPTRQKPPPPIRVDHSDIRIGQVSTLDFDAEDSDCLKGRLTDTARRNIRKAEKEGIIVQKRSVALHELKEIHFDNMEAIGGKPKPDMFFELLPKYFRAGEDYDVYVAERGGEIISALLIFYAGKTVEYFVPVTRLECRRLQPSAAILYRALLDTAKRGFCWWNWGGTWLEQKGVLAFKRKWGAVDYPYHYYTSVNCKDIYDKSREWLLDAYPYFYTVPFGCLRTRDVEG